MIRTEAMRQVRMEEEIPWLERFGYAYGDDRVMAYKLVKRGYRACCVSNALYIHNDGHTATASTEMANTRPSFCGQYFQRIWWQRFIQDLETNPLRKVQNQLCLCYYRMMDDVYRLLKSIAPANRPFMKAAREGYQEGKRYVKSEEYRKLPPVKGASCNRRTT